jgi:hypothetical protein
MGNNVEFVRSFPGARALFPLPQVAAAIGTGNFFNYQRGNMNRIATSRRDFLKCAAMAGAAGLTRIWPSPARADGPFDGDSFVQQVNHIRLYMRHYALFEEPDDNVPPGIYIDAGTGKPTNELVLTPPCESFVFHRSSNNPTEFVEIDSAPVKQLPYFVDPPGFPNLPAPVEVIAAIQAVLGGAVPASVIAANTKPLLVAIGHFEPTPSVIEADYAGGRLAVTRDIEFRVKVRVGFVFSPPPGLSVPSVSILTGWLTRGLVDFLIGKKPDPGVDPNEIVVYDWRAKMNLTTENRYIRTTAVEPKPVADAFPTGLKEISFIGSPVDHDGHYTIVGHAENVPFEAPPELTLFLFGVDVLTDVEFAIEESGVLLPGR